MGKRRRSNGKQERLARKLIYKGKQDNKYNPGFESSQAFLNSYEWRRVRIAAIKKYGNVCQCCGHGPKDGLKIHVDHIKPRKLFPQLALCLDNLQILCEVCNHGKGNWDMTDWRDQHDTTSSLDIQSFQHLAEIARK